MPAPLIPAIKTTANGHQQTYWVSEEKSAQRRNLPLVTPSNEAPEPHEFLQPKTERSSRGVFDRGMKWQDIPDSNPLAALARDRAFEMEGDQFDDSEDVWRKSKGGIEVEFFGRCSTLTLRKINSEATSLFAYGMCAILTHAIHEITEQQIVLFTAEDSEPGDWSGHAAILTGENTVLDIEGFRTFEDVERAYPNTRREVVSFEDFCTIVSAGDDPYEELDELEKLVVKDFAEHVLSEYVEGY